jgi:hypothetical protein
MSMVRSIIAAAFAFFAIIISPPALWAGNSTEGIVLYAPIDGVTVVTVSTDIVEDEARGEGPAVNVINQVNVVNIVAARRSRLRCGIGVPYPWLRKYCLDPLYPF